MRPLVTLTTDFGLASPYVAAMKGVLLAINPQLAIHDLSHSIPPQDVRHANYFLVRCVPYFPAGSIHICVVDPGVGSDRALLLAEAGGQFLLAPDNGCLTGVLDEIGGPVIVRRLTESKFWRSEVSATFHGRDILAPVAGHLSRGIKPDEFGPMSATRLRLETPQPQVGKTQIRGEVLFVDSFGNIITNIPAAFLACPPRAVRIGKRPSQRLAWVRNYAAARPGKLVGLVSSDDLFEIALVNGNAAAKLKAKAGMAVAVRFGR